MTTLKLSGRVRLPCCFSTSHSKPLILLPAAAIAFDAHVIEWTLDKNPPNEYARHHVKEASFYGVDTWSIDLVYKLPPSEPVSLKIHFSGIKEKAMWPGKKGEKEKGGRAMALFEDLDEYVGTKFGGTVDVLLMGCLGGVVTV